MRWVFMHIALKGCRPPHTKEPVQFWIGFGLVLIGGSSLNPLGLLTPHWIIQLVVVTNGFATKKLNSLPGFEPASWQ